jgi:hypothetical protein
VPYGKIMLHTKNGPFNLILDIAQYGGEEGKRVSLMHVFEKGDAYHDTNVAPVLESTKEIIDKFRAVLDDMERDLSPAAAAPKPAAAKTDTWEPNSMLSRFGFGP